jgi:hypothetical protein
MPRGPLIDGADRIFAAGQRWTNDIYHYTDKVALENIVKNKRVWATDLRFMDDPEELTYSLRCNRY